jgi:hypothetical protein
MLRLISSKVKDYSVLLLATKNWKRYRRLNWCELVKHNIPLRDSRQQGYDNGPEIDEYSVKLKRLSTKLILYVIWCMYL